MVSFSISNFIGEKAEEVKAPEEELMMVQSNFSHVNKRLFPF
jgi:hypothetical protein